MAFVLKREIGQCSDEELADISEANNKVFTNAIEHRAIIWFRYRRSKFVAQSLRFRLIEG